jgi:hypothetical protein
MTRICIIAGNQEEAYRWAKNQNMSSDQWFYPKDATELLFVNNFHVIVIGTAGQNVPSKFFEDIYRLALDRGRINRI